MTASTAAALFDSSGIAALPTDLALALRTAPSDA
jgi:hypothetical protein